MEMKGFIAKNRTKGGLNTSGYGKCDHPQAKVDNAAKAPAKEVSPQPKKILDGKVGMQEQQPSKIAKLSR